MKEILKYIKLFLLITYYNVKSRSMYRANFLLAMFQSLITSIVFVMTIWIVLTRFQDIHGWNLYEIGFMLGVARLIHSLTLMFFSTLYFFDMLVNYGELDKLLVKPRSPFFLLMFQRIEIMGIWDTLMALAIIFYAGAHTAIKWSFFNAGYLLLFIASAWIIFFCVMFLAGLLSFWFIKISSLRDFANTTYNMIMPYPLSMYGKRLQIFFTFIIPIGFIYYYPSLHLLEKSDILFRDNLAYLAPGVAAVMIFICGAVWKLGLRNYKSSGS